MLSDTHYASVARTLIATELKGDSPTFYLSVVFVGENATLTEERIKKLASEWRTLNQCSFDDRYPPDDDEEPEAWENLPIETFEGRTLDAIELVKALYCIQYQINDFCSDHLTETTENEEGLAAYRILKGIIREIAEHIITRLPAFQKADTWGISDPNE